MLNSSLELSAISHTKNSLAALDLRTFRKLTFFP